MINKFLICAVSLNFINCETPYRNFYIECKNIPLEEIIIDELMDSLPMLDSSGNNEELFYWIGVSDTLEELRKCIKSRSSCNCSP